MGAVCESIARLAATGEKDVTVAEVDWRRVDLEVGLTHPGSWRDPIRCSSYVVRVRLGDGHVGYGEVAPFPGLEERTRSATLAGLARGRHHVVGAAPAQLLTETGRNLVGLGLSPAVVCGLEQGLLDAIARRDDRSLVAFLGGSAAPARVATPMTVVPGSPESAAEAARFAAECGFKTVKAKVLGPWEHDAERLAAIRGAAPDLAVHLDACGRYGRTSIVHLLSRLRDEHVEVGLLEQPLPAGQWAALPALQREVDVLVCADESVLNEAELLRLVDAGGVHAVNVKPMRSGLSTSFALLRRAEEHGVRSMLGATAETCVSASIVAAMAIAFPLAVEFADLDTPRFMRGLRYEGGLSYDRGDVVVDGSRPGSGVEPLGLFES